MLFSGRKLAVRSMAVLALSAFTLAASPASRADEPAPGAVTRLIVWDGEQANFGGGWVNPTTSSIGPQSPESHSGKTALEFRFKGTDRWMGAGWNWFKFKTGADVGTDARAMKNLSFWVKAKGRVGELEVNLMYNGPILDTPEQHSLRVEVARYCPQYRDGAWHEVVIPLADLVHAAFDARVVSQLQLGVRAAKDLDGSFLFDDIAFDSRTSGTQPASAGLAAVPAPRAFVWKGYCRREDNFVNSHHPVIAGHYEFLADPQEPARDVAFVAHLTPDFTTEDAESFHLHPDIYFDHFLAGSFTVTFDVKVADLVPAELGPYRESPWLNVVTLFDETTRTGGAAFRPSVMVNLVGTTGRYTLQGYSPGHAGQDTVFYDKRSDAPVFPTGSWVTVRVEVDARANRVRVYQDGALASSGPYLGKPGLAGAHMGLYANRKMSRATVCNSNITISVGS